MGVRILPGAYIKMKIIFWSEFPSKVAWSEVKKLFKKHGLNAEIYVACKNIREFKKWKKRISSRNIDVGAWPVLRKKQGYWFSGFSRKKNIDKLKEFSGYKVKIDLELPFPSWTYSDWRAFFYFLGMFFKKGKNNLYLKKTITELSKKSKIIINEFPFNKFALERCGIFYNTKGKKDITKNIMFYTTLSCKIFRPFLKYYLKKFAKKLLRENKNVTFSIGLIGKGILKKERTYDNIKQFKEDLDFIKTLGAKGVAIYSIDAIMNLENPEEWISLISRYQ